jgi:CRISPR-associated protein Cas2
MGLMGALYLVAYDIPDDRRRTRLHKALCGFGAWTQFSLFECFLDDKQLIALRDRISRLIDVEEDNVRIYVICQSCLAKTETFGSERPAEDKVYLI